MGKQPTQPVRNTIPSQIAILAADLLAESKRVLAKQLPEEDELLWDDGSAQPELCLDEFPLVSKVRSLSAFHALALSKLHNFSFHYLQYEALGYTTAGLATFGLIGLAAYYNNKPAKQPYVSLAFSWCCHCQKHKQILSLAIFAGSKAISLRQPED